jgi:hypothetical protein
MPRHVRGSLYPGLGVNAALTGRRYYYAVLSDRALPPTLPESALDQTRH